MSFTQQKLKDAILSAPCIYCLAKPGEHCITCTGNERKESHMQRNHAGHLILIARDEHFCEDEAGERLFMKRSKGHIRAQWETNKERLTGRKRVS